MNYQETLENELKIHQVLIHMKSSFVSEHWCHINNLDYEQGLFEAFKKDMKHLDSFFTEENYKHLYILSQKINDKKKDLNVYTKNKFYHGKERRQYIKKNINKVFNEYFDYIEECREKNQHKDVDYKSFTSTRYEM